MTTLVQPQRKHSLYSSVALLAAVAAIPLGCAEHTIASHVDKFSYPIAVGSNWRYLYVFDKQDLGPFGGLQREQHHALHTWEVSAHRTNEDSTIATINVIRTDTIHYTLSTPAPGGSVDTLYMHLDTLNFPIIFTSTSIVSYWSKTIKADFGSRNPIIVPRTSVADTLKVGFNDPSSSSVYSWAWYVNGIGLVKYTAQTTGFHGYNESLTLIDFVPR